MENFFGNKNSLPSNKTPLLKTSQFDENNFRNQKKRLKTLRLKISNGIVTSRRFRKNPNRKLRANNRKK